MKFTTKGTDKIPAIIFSAEDKKMLLAICRETNNRSFLFRHSYTNKKFDIHEACEQIRPEKYPQMLEVINDKTFAEKFEERFNINVKEFISQDFRDFIETVIEMNTRPKEKLGTLAAYQQSLEGKLSQEPSSEDLARTFKGQIKKQGFDRWAKKTPPRQKQLPDAPISISKGVAEALYMAVDIRLQPNHRKPEVVITMVRDKIKNLSKGKDFTDNLKNRLKKMMSNRNYNNEDVKTAADLIGQFINEPDSPSIKK